MSESSPTERTRVRRLPGRASYDRATMDAILDEGLVCHLGFVHDGQPFVLPTTYARVEDALYVHGSAASRMLRGLRDGIPVSATVTLLDGLVLARSAFHHSMNYRWVVILGVATEVTGPDERLRALAAIVEHVAPGRWAEVRPPNERELKATMVLRLPIAEASAKIRSGPPLDDAEDLGWPCWAGHVPPAGCTHDPPVAHPRSSVDAPGLAGATAPC
ncbi:MAG: pyridoxamine 5'-phosphate oxidase family protein [Deltaproteobacteria bacterium]|nr:MAG: pyridoxamine 5'-phosphate oxidase family protein [Deltaproteobacteria bacterium]